MTRALVRWALSRCTGHPPEVFTFTKNAWGKPQIARPQELREVRFNLSSTRGMVACVVALGVEVGVDVEDTTREGETVEVADRFFSAAEIADLRAQPAFARRDRFFDYWTLREAYIKCVGRGLAIPLGSFTIVLEDDSRARVDAATGIDEGPRCQLQLFRPSSRHRLATAVRSSKPGMIIVPRRVVPFAG